MNEYANLLALLGIGGAHPGGIELTKRLIEDCNIHIEDNILEVGCGTGQTTTYLIMAGFDVTPIDYHPLMIEKANKRFRELNLKCKAIQKDIHEPILLDKMFDVIIAESVLSFTKLTKSIPQLKCLLKEKGKLIAVEMTKTKSLSEDLEKEIKSFYQLPQLLTEQDWKDSFEANGLQVKITELNLTDLPISEPELHPSEHIEERYFQILTKHEELVYKTKNTLKASIIVANKK
ncbi:MULTISPECIES: class I SAM-dependent methyltransferase [Bacillus]|uniref:class I SAM-dependent methyltransferase n=1 Tax=Bacillus TaxID=1386 RepID=UPI000BB8407A|nr:MULTISPECIES: class I SAM-dependent methyltransferase [Bacillus]